MNHFFKYLFIIFLSTEFLHADWESCIIGFNNDVYPALSQLNDKIFIGNSNDIYYSTNNGDSWATHNSWNKGIQIFTFANIGDSIFLGTSAGCYFSPDNGKNWVPRNFGIKDTIISVTSFVIDKDTIFISTYGGGIYKSTNFGESWLRKNNGLFHLGVTYIIKINNQYIAATWGQGGIYISSNNCEYWVNKKNGLISDYIRTIGCNSNKIFCGPGDAGFYLSYDYGENWVIRNQGLSNHDIYSITFYKNNIFIGTYGGGVFYSDNFGESWNQFNTGLKDLNIYQLIVKDNYLFASTKAGIFRAELDSNIPKVELDNHRKFTFEVIPNLVSSHINIILRKIQDLKCADNNLEVQIYNTLGETVLKSFLPSPLGETQSLRLDVSSFPEGIYFVKIGEEIHKFLLIK